MHSSSSRRRRRSRVQNKKNLIALGVDEVGSERSLVVPALE